MNKLYPLLKISELLAKEKIGKLTQSERDFIDKWLSENSRNKEIYQKLLNDDFLANELNELEKFDSKKAFEIVTRRIENKSRKTKTIKFIPTYLKYAAAIAVIAICSYLLFTITNKKEIQQIAQCTIFPGKQKAILLTAKNQLVVLNSTVEKQEIKGELAKIVNSGNTLSYNTNNLDTKTKQVEYNTLIAPRGGEYTLILSDGTEVMLNSGSKLKYPVIFNNDIRQVELEGEAFFKVTKSNKIPFIVKVNNLDVTVYGTVFNIQAYDNENSVQTTLLEGSVGVRIYISESNVESIIKPGQQLSLNKKTGISETKEVNTDQFIAWTKGMFVFENEPIENILMALSRWYNFNFEFKNLKLKNQRFTLSLGKYDNVSKILDMISTSSNIKFSINENLIIVGEK